MNVIMTVNKCDKTNSLPKMKNCAEHTMICPHYLIREIVLEISNEIKSKEVLRGDLR